MPSLRRLSIYRGNSAGCGTGGEKKKDNPLFFLQERKGTQKEGKGEEGERFLSWGGKSTRKLDTGKGELEEGLDKQRMQ